MDKSREFIALISGEIGKAIYVWGGDGELMDSMSDPTGWIRKHETTKRNGDRSVAYYQKLVGQGKKGIRAYDCSGLMFWALKQLGLQGSDINSRGLYGKCEKLNRSELRAGDLVFHYNGTKISHVGAFVGAGATVECKGRDVGVVKTKLSASYWNRFGRFPGLYDVDEIEEEYSEPELVDLRSLYLTSPMLRGADVRALQEKLLALGCDLGSTGVDGVFGSKTSEAVRQTKTFASLCKADAVCDERLRALLGL